MWGEDTRISCARWKRRERSRWYLARGIVSARVGSRECPLNIWRGSVCCASGCASTAAPCRRFGTVAHKALHTCIAHYEKPDYQTQSGAMRPSARRAVKSRCWSREDVVQWWVVRVEGCAPHEAQCKDVVVYASVHPASYCHAPAVCAVVL